MTSLRLSARRETTDLTAPSLQRVQRRSANKYHRAAAALPLLAVSSPRETALARGTRATATRSPAGRVREILLPGSRLTAIHRERRLAPCRRISYIPARPSRRPRTARWRSPSRHHCHPRESSHPLATSRPARATPSASPRYTNARSLDVPVALRTLGLREETGCERIVSRSCRDGAPRQHAPSLPSSPAPRPSSKRAITPAPAVERAYRDRAAGSRRSVAQLGPKPVPRSIVPSAPLARQLRSTGSAARAADQRSASAGPALRRSRSPVPRAFRLRSHVSAMRRPNSPEGRCTSFSTISRGPGEVACERD